MTVDLETGYLGLSLRSPLVASSSPLTGEIESARQLEDSGVGAIVLPSLFEEEILYEEIELDRSLDAGSEQFAEALQYFPRVGTFHDAADRYIARLREIKRGATIPVIASLNGASPGGWTQYAQRLQDAGADALELNIYRVAANPAQAAADMEAIDLDMIARVREAITIPLAVKLSPYYSALANFAARAITSGADGLVLFNRFYQPDLDLDELEVVNRLELSRPWRCACPCAGSRSCVPSSDAMLGWLRRPGSRRARMP